MLILAMESSCDETAAAVVEGHGSPLGADGPLRLAARSDVVASQVQVHAAFGGVVPEVASRQHLIHVLPVVDQALREAGVGLDDLDGVAVTRGPGLIGALLVAVQTAKAIAFARDLPLCGVNHLEGHLLAAFLTPPGAAAAHQAPPLPHLGLLVSGGHTLLVRVDAPGRYQVLGTTRDDAAGEAFDKGGKLLRLGYPAGPVIDRLARGGDPGAVAFSRGMTGKKGGLDFSYSGLKTALSAHLAAHHGGGPPDDPQGLADLCASYQAAIVEQLVRKATLALEQTGLRALVVSGGVACNSALRAALAARCAERGVAFHAAPPRYCTDNAAMIGAAGYLRLAAGERADLTLCAQAQLPLSLSISTPTPSATP